MVLPLGFDRIAENLLHIRVAKVRRCKMSWLSSRYLQTILPARRSASFITFCTAVSYRYAHFLFTRLPPTHTFYSNANADAAPPAPYRLSEICSFGPSSTARASFRANSSMSRSRSRFATRKFGMPACFVPKNSPGPRCCKSNSAISKPFCVRTIAVQPLFRLGRNLPARHQHAIRLRRSAPNPPAQLMQLRKSETFRMLDNHDAGVGNIHSHFNHRGRHQHVNRARAESSPWSRLSRRRSCARAAGPPAAPPNRVCATGRAS